MFTTETEDLLQGRQQLQQVEKLLNEVILGKQEVIEHLLVALLTEGHVLLEDIPGLGKTTLAKAFADVLDCDFRRIQFTPDLLPSDVVGISIYHPSDQRFHFQKGPVFTQILMADEINRASPRTQSSLLEAMAEKQVSIEGQQYRLESPFMVIATQNPLEYQGTYPLPEAQLDRFLMCLSLGYPSAEQEIAMLYQQSKARVPSRQKPLELQALKQLQAARQHIQVHQDIAVMIMKLVETTRQAGGDIQLGVSPRGSLALFQSAQARALLKGRDFVIPEDVLTLAPVVLSHRLILSPQASLQRKNRSALIRQLISELALP